MTNRVKRIGDAVLINGDCIQMMNSITAQSIQTCITSPPYFGLRDYGHDGQIGLEKTPDDYVSKLVEVFQAVRRVLRDDGTVWLNLGDSYSGYKGANYGKTDGNLTSRTPVAVASAVTVGTPQTTGLKNKQLLGIPWRVAFALQADGWYLRQDIIWAKPNPMPESVKDRCTKSHEYIFLLSKKPKYHYDYEAIKEPVAASTNTRMAQNIDGQTGSDRVPGKTNGPMKAVGGTDGLRNKRDVWTVTTRPYKGVHFATFPPLLIEPCILAGCPVNGVVLDPFSGSGTTGQVALQHGRSYIGIELNPEYQQLAVRRLSA